MLTKERKESVLISVLLTTGKVTVKDNFTNEH